jgi:predicted  nucleic acid-binding Zn-ribbon protein
MTLPLEVLLHLQQLDHQHNALHERLAQVPVEVAKVRQRVEAAGQAKTQAQQALDDCQKRRREKELDVQAQEERLDKLKARGDIKTNKEYQAHLAEVETAKHAKSAAEDELLLLMEQADTFAQQVKRCDGQSKEVTSQATVEEAKLAEERERIQREAEQLAGEIAQVERTIEPALLKEYQRLRSRGKGLIIVAIQNGGCAGCRLAVPPQLIAEVRRQETAQHCPHCGRFLYWPHTVPA